MDKSQVNFVESEGFTINLPTVGAPVTVRTKSDEIVILMRLTLRPRDNMMNVAIDVSTGGNSASVSRFDENAPSDVSRYWRASIHKP